VKAVEELKKVIDNVQSEKYNDRLNEKITEILNNFVQSDIMSLFVYNDENKVLEEKLYYNRKNKSLKNMSSENISLSMIDPQGCIGKVFLTKNVAIYNYILSDKEYVEAYDNVHGHKLKAQMLMPIVEDDILLGIVTMSTLIKGNLQRYTQKELAQFKASLPYYVHLVKILKNSKKVDDINTLTSYDISLETNMQNKPVNDDSMLLFFSNTVHDIRTPANSLYGFLELLEDKLEDKRLKEFVINAKESAAFINTLTTSILDTAKNRYQSTQSASEIVCPTKFISDIANTFSAKMLEKKVHYFIYISPNIPKELKLDSMKLQRVLTNLIGNAYKFTPKKKEIHLTITWNEAKNSIHISVRDTGIGIDEENQKKLFKAFAQATDDTHEKYGGTGLGLAISAGYVADLGGELKLKSKLNVGSEFYFEIPIDVVDAEPKYEPFYNLEKKIVILTEYSEAKYPAFIRKYLIDFGMPEEKIVIASTLEENATHVICFEEKITEEIIALGNSKKIKLLLVEQVLFSLLTQKEISSLPITSKNVYNADAIYSTVYSGKKMKVLIVDDNKINISLLEAMLEASYVDVTACEDAKEALKILKKASKNNCSYDIIYLDKHMPVISGTEMLTEFRAYEKKHALKPIYAVSISGDPYIPEEEQKLFDTLVAKPFKKEEVRNVILTQRSK